MNNVIRAQIWFAMCVYTLVGIMKKELRMERSMNQMPPLIRVTIFDKAPLLPKLFT